MMKSVTTAMAGALVVVGLSAASAMAGPLPALETLKGTAAEQTMVEKTHGVHAACEWSRFRGWHRSGRYGSWSSCRPGPTWRYINRCWIGPRGVRHCRFVG
jgi:hypothetical protein